MIYLDYNATTPVDPRVLDQMLPYFGEHFANPASRQHRAGIRARDAVEAARTGIAQLLGAAPEELFFTSGATESCNLAIKGVRDRYRRKGRHFVAPVTEHKAVLDCLRHLESYGAEVSLVPVARDGIVEPDALAAAIRPDTVLVSVMWANNETGVIQPMQEIGQVCRQHGVLLFSDASQAVGKIDVDPRAVGVQLLALSGHKCYGPKGIGALYVSARSPQVRLEPLIHGGGHEGGMRSGTLNVPGVVGLAAAVRLAHGEMDEFARRTATLRDLLETAFSGQCQINGATAQRLPHVSNLAFAGLDGPALMQILEADLAIASGSACTAADPEPSHVLMAMGLSRAEANGSLRISLGRFTTDAEVSRAIALLRETLPRFVRR